MNAQWQYRRWQLKKRYKRMVRTVCRALYEDTGRDVRNSIIVAGVARSGTTWLANVIASQFSCRIMFEPFYSVEVPEFRQFQDFQYMRPEEDHDELYSVCRKILSGDIRNPWIDVSVECIFPESRLIKEVRANLFLRWIHDRFPEIPILFIIRHPCAVVHSDMKMDWPPDRDIDAFLRQHNLVDDFLSDKMDMIRNAETVEAKHAIIWCVSNLVPIRQFSSGKLNVVFYEHLCTQPAVEISKIFKAINRDYKNSVLKLLNQPSFMSRRASAILKGEDKVLSWKQQLSSRQIANILGVVEAFELDHLYGDSATPRMDGALDQRLIAS